MAKTVTLNFNNNSVTLNTDSEGRLNLNQLHAASGVNASRRPGSWLRGARIQQLVDNLSTAQKRAVVSVEGRGEGSGTWAIEEVVYGYAAWISPSFHAAVLEAFTAAANGDAVRAVKVAQSVVRVEGIGLRKAFCSQLGRHKATKGDYGSMTDIINIQVLGVSSSTKRRELGIKESAPLRDHLTDDQLLDLAAAEALAAMMMNKNANRDRGSMREAVYRAVELIKTV